MGEVKRFVTFAYGWGATYPRIARNRSTSTLLTFEGCRKLAAKLDAARLVIHLYIFDACHGSKSRYVSAAFDPFIT